MAAPDTNPMQAFLAVGQEDNQEVLEDDLAFEPEPEEEVFEEYSIPAPDGFMPPDTARQGEAFDLVAKVRLNNGVLVFDSLNGVPLSGGGTASANASPASLADAVSQYRGYER